MYVEPLKTSGGRQHPAVAEVAVIGLPDAFTGFALKAFVRLAPRSIASPRELADFRRLRMSAKPARMRRAAR